MENTQHFDVIDKEHLKHLKHVARGFVAGALILGAILLIALLQTKITPYVIEEEFKIEDASFEIQADVLEDILAQGSAQVIIELRDNGNVAGIQSSISDSVGLNVKHKYSSVNAMSGEITLDGLKNLADNPGIKRIYVDPIVEIVLSESSPMISADDVWNIDVDGGITGTGQTICVIDTGINPSHSSLIGRVSDQKCYCSISGSSCCPNGEQEDVSAQDDNGHGTHVAGIIASNDGTYKGVAPNANIIAVKTCNSQGYCAGSDLIAGIEYCTNISAEYNIRAISMSIGGAAYTTTCDSISQSLTDVVNNAVNQGIAVVIASGNNGYSNKISWPSCVESAISVGSVTKQDQVAGYSNRNALLDYLAPGGDSSGQIVSSNYQGGFFGKYGTSMATPHVSGAIVLLWQYIEVYGGYTPTVSEIKSLLTKSAITVNDEISGLDYNRIDVKAAIDLILKVNNLENSVENPGKGKVIYFNATDFNHVSEAFIIEDNLISLDSNNWPQFNKPATLEIYGLSFEKEPAVLVDGAVCDLCSIVSYTNGTFIFSVPGFTSYSAGANSVLDIWDETVERKEFYEGKALPTEEISFFARYNDRISEEDLVGECSIVLSENASVMNYDIEKGVFEFVDSFDVIGDYAYEITCSKENYETIVLNSSLLVNKTSPVMSMVLNGEPNDIYVIPGTSVEITASLVEPANGSFEVLINGELINSVENTYSNKTVFENYGVYNISTVYSETVEYFSGTKTLFVTVIDDISPPNWVGEISTSGRYGEENIFTISWEDNVAVDNAWVEHNFEGGSLDIMNYSGTEFFYNAGEAPVGMYQIRFHANDTSGNINSTELINYTIEKGINKVQVDIEGYINDNITLSYREFTVQGNSSGGDVELYKDGTAVANPFVSYLDVGNYVFMANTTGNENYEGNAEGVIAVLQVSKVPSDVKLYLNGDRDDITRAKGKDVDIRVELFGPTIGSVKLYKGGSLIEEKNAPYEVTRTFSSDTTIEVVFDGDDSYEGSSESHRIDVISSSADQTEGVTGPTAPAPTLTTQKASCTERWNCNEWSSCEIGKQTRTCVDLSRCGTTKNKPPISQPCDLNCTPEWECNDWTKCVEGSQRRLCNDMNYCGDNVKEDHRVCELKAAPLLEDLNTLKDKFMKLTEERPINVALAIGLLAALLGFLGYDLFLSANAPSGNAIRKFKSMWVDVRIKASSLMKGKDEM